MENFPPLSAPLRRGLEEFPGLVDRVFPLPGKYRRGLPRDVAELSRLLTSGRGDRDESYLGRPAFLSAYLRYFLPWNLYRLCRLLPALPLPLEEGGLVRDLGAGPLTLTLGLWLSRPDLRDRPLEFHCVDRTGAVLEAGEELFRALAPGAPWRVRRIRVSLGELPPGPEARLTTGLNLFNELYGKIPAADRRGLGDFAEKNARLLSRLTSPSGAILVVEPGVPRSGEFIAALRSRLAARGFSPRAPCPHTGPCPLEAPPGGRGKWCHFALDTAAAPAGLRRLSVLAGLPKERAALSFIFAGPSAEGEAAPEPRSLPVRVLSDSFPLGAPRDRAPRFGRYGCSVKGLALIAGERSEIEGREAGSLVDFLPEPPGRRDQKSGALLGAPCGGEGN